MIHQVVVSWYINNSIFLGNTNTISTTFKYISNNTFVNVSLTLFDTIVGCVVTSDSNFTFTAPPFIALDTSITNTNLPTHYDTTFHGFSGCNTVNGQINLTFSNSNIIAGNQNIDSLVFLWPDSTTSILTDSLYKLFIKWLRK